MKLAFLSLFLLAPALGAQWAAPLPASGAPVTVEGFLALHDDGVSIQAFSAFTQDWLAIAPAGAAVVGTGDWTALIDLPGGARTAYSARLQATAAGPAGPALDVRVEDDVIYVLQNAAAGFVLNAYSAETNLWQAIVFPDLPLVATSRFVVCAYSPASGQIAGFGARFGQWNVLALGVCDPPVADGNVGALFFHDPAGIVNAVAFSGVTNIWNISPPTSTLLLAVDHDVALVNLSAGGGFRGGAYSAYSSTWIASPVITPAASVVATTLRDKLVLIERSGNPRFEAIGALPHTAWVAFTGPMLSLLGLAQDAAVVRDAAAGQVRAFGGLRGGAWAAQAVAGPPVFEGAPEHAALVSDAGGGFHAFSPMTGTWANQNVPGATVFVGDCVAVIAAPGGNAFAWSSRHGAWVPGPAPAAGITYVHGAVGSVVSREGRDLAGGTSVDLTLFDERYGVWRTPFALAGPGFALLQGMRNALLVTDGATRLGYSIQRDDLVADAGFLPSIFTAVEEDVAVVRDAGGNLHAFGSPEKTHDLYDYPLDTETQHFSSPVFGGQIVRLTVRGTTPGIAILQVSAAALNPALMTPFGCLTIGGAVLATPPSVGISPSGVGTITVVLPVAAGPLLAWAEGGSFNLVTFVIAFAGCKAEPIAIF